MTEEHKSWWQDRIPEKGFMIRYGLDLEKISKGVKRLWAFLTGSKNP